MRWKEDYGPTSRYDEGELCYQSLKVYGAMTEESGATSRMKTVWCY